jgi:hypothetical protein
MTPFETNYTTLFGNNLTTPKIDLIMDQQSDSGNGIGLIKIVAIVAISGIVIYCVREYFKEREKQRLKYG